MSAEAKILLALQCWNKLIINFTEKAGLIKSTSDLHLFCYMQGDSAEYIVTYDDDDDDDDDDDGLVGNRG
jgi:hypothetical protein